MKKLSISVLFLGTLTAFAVGAVALWKQPWKTKVEQPTGILAETLLLEGQDISFTNNLISESLPVEAVKDWRPDQGKLQSLKDMTTGEVLDKVASDSREWIEQYQADLGNSSVIDGVQESVLMYSLASAYRLTGDESYLSAFRQGVAYFKPVLLTAQSPRGELVYFPVNNVVQANAMALYALGWLELSSAGVKLSSSEQQVLTGMIEYIAASVEDTGVFDNYYLESKEIGCREMDYNSGWSLAVLAEAYRATKDVYYIEKADQAADYLFVTYPTGDGPKDRDFYIGGARALRALFELTGEDRYQLLLVTLTQDLANGHQYYAAFGEEIAENGLLYNNFFLGLLDVFDYFQTTDPSAAEDYRQAIIRQFPKVVLTKSDQDDPQKFIITASCSSDACIVVQDASMVSMYFKAAIQFQRSLSADEQLQPAVVGL